VFSASVRETNTPRVNLTFDLPCPDFCVGFRNELQTRYRRVRLFLPTLLREVTFEAAPAGGPVVEAIEYLQRHEVSPTPDDKPPVAIVPKTWQRYVYGPNDSVDQRAYGFCVLDQLREALRRRDVFVTPSWRYTEMASMIFILCFGRDH